jgi:hypothetical protein
MLRVATGGRTRAPALIIAVLLGTGSVVGVLAPACRVSAEPATAEAQARYRELIRKALDEYALGNWPEAKVYFREAHALWPNARTYRGLGLICYESRDYVEAISFLEQALVHPEQPLSEKLAGEVQRVLGEARLFVASLEVLPSAAEVTIDGQAALRSSDGKMLVDPGLHHVQANAPGYVTLYSTVKADGGNQLTLQMEPQRSVSTDEPSPPLAADARLSSGQDRGPGHESSLLGPLLAPVGVAGLAGGWGFYLLRQTPRRALPPTLEPAPLRSDIGKFRTYGWLSMSSAIVGTGLLAVSEYYWLPDEPSLPPWAWVIGGAGVAVAVTGIALGAFGTHCDIADTYRDCQAVTSDILFGPLLAVHALPLLSVPLVYALRSAFRNREVRVAVSWTGDAIHGGGVLNVTGRF